MRQTKRDGERAVAGRLEAGEATFPPSLDDAVRRGVIRKFLSEATTFLPTPDRVLAHLEADTGE
jgi:hypothetical protein